MSVFRPFTFNIIVHMLEPKFSILLVLNFASFVSYSCVSIFLSFCGLLEQFLEFKLNFFMAFPRVSFDIGFSAVVL